MSNKSNNAIKCDVESCKHQDNTKCECQLDQIKVVCSCNEEDCNCPSDTACASYECSKDKAEE